MFRMDSSHHVTVPLRYGIKKMRKRRDLDRLLLSQGHGKGSGGGGACGGGPLRRGNDRGGTLYSQDKLLNNAASTDDQEDYNWQPKVKQPTHHCGHNKQLIFRLYGILLFVITLSIFVGFTYWLNFNLQQQIYEYRQKVEQVSAASQILPDTLQAWHETSKNLIKNQTSISSKLTELQQSLQVLWKNFSEYRTSQEAQKSYKEEKIVADFGAKIEAIATDVESMKDHYNAVKVQQTDLQKVFENLKSNFSDGLKNMALPVNYTEELKSLRMDLQSKIDKLEANNSFINDTLTQKSIIMQEELVKHKTKLDELFDRSANITSHVTSLENSWPEYKQKIINLGNDVPRLEKDISLLTLNSQKMEMSFKNICKECQNSYIEALQQHNIVEEKPKPVENIKPSETKTTTTTLRPSNV